MCANACLLDAKRPHSSSQVFGFSPLRPMAAVFIVVGSFIVPVSAQTPISIGNERQLFIDDSMLSEIDGHVRRHVIQPEPREVVFVADQTWEGNTSGYYTLFQDGEIYRMIYRGWQHDEKMRAAHPEVTCYAESTDGIHWVRPNLGLHTWKGSKDNNIIWMGSGAHNFTAFRDTNPNCRPDARYKAFGSGGAGGGLIAMVSPDCKHWKRLQDQPVITRGAFDSQNLAFWDPHEKVYRAYWRYFTKGVTTADQWQPAGLRAIRTATSKDFVHWENEADLTYYGYKEPEHLYTNAIQKYFRSPSLFIGFPTRYLPDQGQRVEPVVMASRDGVHFRRWGTPVVSEEAPKDRKGNRSNYMTWGILQLPDNDQEISVYATENYYERTPGRVRRFVYRTDGFVALQGDRENGGSATTPPLAFGGSVLNVNYAANPRGTLSVEVLDLSGRRVATSDPLQGDDTEQALFRGNKQVFNGEPRRLRFHLKNAAVYSFQFAN